MSREAGWALALLPSRSCVSWRGKSQLMAVGLRPDRAYHYSCLLVYFLNPWTTMIRRIMDGGSID
jgi:hypothetical protein